MRNILIIYPHWPPSNLAGVHRPRLIANFLPELGWHPIILCAHERYYEEELDPDIERTVSPEVEVIKTKAYSVLKFFGKRLIGDLGIRALPFLYKESLKIISRQKVDFIWIPIPSWYPALLGPLIHRKTGIPYGIDYIDPWVSQLAPYEGILSRAWLANRLARFLEPIAVKQAALISGVSTPYYQPVLERNFQGEYILHVGMPYGFDPRDHQIELPNIDYPWPKDGSIIPYVYAGAFLPQSHLFVKILFKAVARLKGEKIWPSKARLYFLGTGSYGGPSIAEYAQQAGVSDVVTEIRRRYPFLHIQQFLRSAAGVLIIGSTERHYTASKTFQCLLSNRPLYAILHKESSAAEIIQKCNANRYLLFHEQGITHSILSDMAYNTLKDYILMKGEWLPNLQPLQTYSAKESAKALVLKIESFLSSNK